MEIAGLVVGGVSLVGLFSACIEAIDRIKSYRDVEIESQQLSAQFEANRIIFKNWADRVGITKDGVCELHDRRLDDPSTARAVFGILTSLRYILNKADPSQDTPTNINTDKYRIPDASIFTNTISKSSRKRDKIHWTLRGKQSFTEQVRGFTKLNELLNALIPGREGFQNSDTALQILKTEESKRYSFLAVDLLLMLTDTDQARKALLDWIGPIQYDDRYESCKACRTQGTCSWIFQNKSFVEWRSSAPTQDISKFLWIHGPAGYGKSVLCAAIIQSLKSDENIHSAYYFYVSATKRQEVLITTLRAWIVQMVTQDDDLLDLAHEQLLESSYQVGTVFLWNMFTILVHNAINWVFVIDGMDECQHSQESDKDRWSMGESRLDFLIKLRKAIAGTAHRVLVVSRDEVDIRSQLGAIGPHTDGSSFYELGILRDDVEPDVMVFSQSVVNSRLSNKPETVKNNIAKKMTSKCEGMFLWIDLQQLNLRGGKNEKQLLRTIDAMPAGLESVYEWKWKNILEQPDDDRSRALNILRWATFAVRPLTVAELTDALLVPDDDECEDLPVDELPDYIDEEYVTDQISGLCGSLIELRNGKDSDQAIKSKTIHLKHFSVKQFLLSTNASSLLSDTEIKLPSTLDIHSNYLASTCLRYLQYKAIEEDEISRKAEQAFINYATQSWYQHVPTAQNIKQGLRQNIENFFATQNKSWDLWSLRFDELWCKEKPTYRDEKRRIPARIHYAAWLGLEGIVKSLYSNDASVIDAIGGDYGTPIKAACAGGHSHLVQWLGELGARLNTTEGHYGNILGMASHQGNIDICTYVLDKGAGLTLTDRLKRTPVLLASTQGYFEVVKLLLDRGADVNVVDIAGRSPIGVAAYNGHLDVVKLLLGRGADLNRAYNGWTPLDAASSQGHLEMVELLLNRGADLNETYQDVTPVHAASYHGHIDVVKSLLDRGADLTVADKTGRIPLHTACNQENLELIKLLLDHGADVNAVDNEGLSPLLMASYGSNPELIKLLLNHGADMDVIDDEGRSPLLISCSKGNLEIIKLLLDHGADLTVVFDNHGLTLLHEASFRGQLEVVNLLLATGQVEINAKDHDGRSSLFWAAYNGHEATIRLLFSTGYSELDCKDKYGQTPLSIASRRGFEAIVEFFLSEDEVDPDSTDEFGRTPLTWATAKQYPNIVSMILQKLEKKGIPDYRRDKTAVETGTRNNGSRTQCDICLLHVTDAYAYQHCSICRDGDFDICQYCSAYGALCLDFSHGLTLIQSKQDVHRN